MNIFGLVITTKGNWDACFDSRIEEAKRDLEEGIDRRVEYGIKNGLNRLEKEAVLRGYRSRYTVGTLYDYLGMEGLLKGFKIKGLYDDIKRDIQAGLEFLNAEGRLEIKWIAIELLDNLPKVKKGQKRKR